MSQFELLYGYPVLACFDGDDNTTTGVNSNLNDDEPSVDSRLKQAEEEAKKARDEADRKAAEARQAAEAAEAAKMKAFSQEDVNTYLAEDRRKHTEKYKKLESAYQEMLADKTLAAEQRGKLEAELEDLQKTFRTKEQQAEYERKQERAQYENELKTSREAAIKWEKMYKGSVIQRSLQDAAVGAEAFNPGQIIGLLTPITQMREKLNDDGKETGEMIPMVDFQDIDEKTGEQIITLRTPQEAVQRMKELPEYWGNLFRANVVSGIGSGAATGGVTSGSGGRIDPAKLTPDQYRKLRKENPEALGLRKRP
jgi:hypothetical protein